MNEFHPIANIFPLMSDAELAELAEDIGEHGLREPIWRHRDGRIIDGRNRFLACEKAGAPCHGHTFEGEDHEIPAFVASLNIHRRHLSESQRAMAAAKLANMRQGGDRRSEDFKGPMGTLNVTAAEAAELLNVGERSVKRARAIIESGDEDVIQAMERGEISGREAERRVRREPERQPPPKPRLVHSQPAPLSDDQLARVGLWLRSGATITGCDGEAIVTGFKAAGRDLTEADVMPAYLLAQRILAAVREEASRVA